MENSHFPQNYLSVIATGAADPPFDHRSLIIAKEDDLQIAYAPFDHVALGARLVIVGITPGAAQATAAIKAYRAAILTGADVLEALALAKSDASFSGPLRTNLVAMLDAIGVGEYFGLASSDRLFDAGSGQVHFTSALRYPVFRNKKNYNGTPNMLKAPVLRNMIDTYLAEEARQLPEALWLPLGPKPGEALQHLVQRGLLKGDRVLAGMPHPSGANAERVSVFLGRKLPQEASRQTNGFALCAASKQLKEQMSELNGGVQ